MKWVIKRFEANYAGPIPETVQCTFIMQDVDASNAYKYEIRNFARDDLILTPEVVLQVLQTDGYTPNDFGLPM